MNHFRAQIAQIRQKQADRREASEMARLDQREDILTTIEICQAHEAYWEELLRPKEGYGEDWAFPDHPQHSAFLAKMRQAQQESEFWDRVRSSSTFHVHAP